MPYWSDGVVPINVCDPVARENCSGDDLIGDESECDGSSCCILGVTVQYLILYYINYLLGFPSFLETVFPSNFLQINPLLLRALCK